MDRRKFTTIMGVAVAGMVAGSRVSAQQKADDKAPKHVCKGQNACKGQGGCKSGDNGCAGKNSCKGKGGCSVPVNPAHMGKSEKSSCGGKNGCKGR